MLPNYIGGKKLKAGFQAPTPKFKAGFQAPTPEIIAGKKKRQKNFKSNVKGQKYVDDIKKEFEKENKKLGLKNINEKQETDKIKKERLKFKSLVNKGATQIKKRELNSGSTKKKANESKKKYMDIMKHTLKRLITKHTLLALQEFNNKISS